MGASHPIPVAALCGWQNHSLWIPLNTAASAGILEPRERAKLLFGVEPQPEWYVFPHKEGFTKPDATRPMSGWRTA
jgi:hypothetical protein